MKYLAFLLAPLALAACGDGGTATGNGTAPAAAPVAAATPPAGTSWTDTVVQTAEGFRMGNPDAPIKMVEYGSRLCPACRALALEGFAPLAKNYVSTGKVSFEFREFLIHGASDLPPALIGSCAGTAPFFPLLDQMFENQTQFLDRAQAATPEMQARMQAATPQQGITLLAEQMGMIEFAKQRGIPEAKARQCLADDKRAQALADQTQAKGADGTVTGTPTVLINGRKVDGITWPDVEKALKNAGA